MNSFIRRSWVEIDLSQIKKNYELYKKNIPQAASVMAVIKANAYGHGDIEVARTLTSVGVNKWAVSNIDEACKLRQAGITGDILILGYTPIEKISILEENDITQAILSEEYADLLLRHHCKAKCQFALDTGMNRIGLDADDPQKCIETISFYFKNLKIDGLFTHLCVADSDESVANEFTQKQINKFETVVNGVNDFKLNSIHCLNSSGCLWKKTEYDSLVRLGIILYGLKPDSKNILPIGIKPVMRWKSIVSMVKTVKSGEYIGYGCSFRAEKNMEIATISTGYADGYNRMLSNKGHVLIEGKKASIVGRICMDQFMVDVSDIPGVELGTEVQLLTDNYNADDMAQDIGTIGYEIVCNISDRVTRIYL